MSRPQQKSQLNVAFGCATFGAEGAEAVRVSSHKDAIAILDVFKAHGHYELDTARIYGNGTSEGFLAAIDWKGRGFTVDTKLYPVRGGAFGQKEDIYHTPEHLRKYLDLSLKELKTDSVDIFYLHAPDRSTPFEVTLKAVNDLYKEGKFKRFGISNFISYEVAEVVEICKANGYVLPTVYQGMYNAIARGVEPELFPALRKYGLSFYAYSPLAGGFFTTPYRSVDAEVEAGSRFDSTRMLGQLYRSRYWDEPHFNALRLVEAAASKHGLTLAEVAYRWLSHHSALKREHGDTIVIGVSSTKHIEQNLLDLEKGPLPDDVVKALDEAWLSLKATAAPYWH